AESAKTKERRWKRVDPPIWSLVLALPGRLLDEHARLNPERLGELCHGGEAGWPDVELECGDRGSVDAGPRRELALSEEGLRAGVAQTGCARHPDHLLRSSSPWHSRRLGVLGDSYPSPVPDPRVEPGVGQVDRQIDE